MAPGQIELQKRGRGLQQFKDACIASISGVQNAILGIDFPSSLPGSAPLAGKHRKRQSGVSSPSAIVDRLLFASAPFASIRNSASRATNPEVELLGSDDAGLHIRASQGAAQGNVDASALRRNRGQLGDATSTSLSDLDDIKSDGTSSVVTDEDRAKYSEEKFLVHRVELVGADRELTRLAEEVLQVKENFRCSQADVYDSIRAIQELGYFDEVAVLPVDSRDGITLQFKLSPLPPFRGYRVEGHTMLPPDVVEPIFQNQVGKTSNFKLYQEAVRRIDEWYDKNGILGAVMKDENPYESLGFQNGEFVFKVSEVKLGNISLKFVNDDGEPIKGVTKPKVVMREVRTQSGEIFDQKKLMQTLDGIASTGLFDDVRMVPSERITDSSVGVVEPDEATLDVTIMLQEKEKMRHVTGGIGLSTEGRQTVPIAAVSFSHINLFGNAQKLSASLQFNQLERSFNCDFSDPWLNSGPRHISQVLGISNDRKSGDALFARVQGEEPSGDDTENAENPASSIAIERLRMSVERSMPLRDGLVGTAGMSCMRNRCVGADGRTLLRDPYQWPLTKSPNGEDFSLKLSATLAYNNIRRGLQSMLMLERSLGAPKAAWQNTWLSFTRATGKVCKEFPLGPVTLRLAGQGGAHHGDCPPYEAHQLGGVNCVRGWAEGGMGTGRNWVQASAETEWSIVDNVHGVVFVDAGSDLNSGQSVLGDPAGARGKDGNGLGYGLGVRIPSPLGPIRLEYAWTNKHNWLGADSTLIPRGRFHLGIGARF